MMGFTGPDELVRELEDPFSQSEPYSPEPPLSDREEDCPSMSEPSSEELDELMEPKPAWMDSSEGSSEVSDVDSEKSDIFHVSLSTRKALAIDGDRDVEKIRALARFLRERPLLPPDP